MSGTLYVVATPIGNLEDITLRALRVLRDVTVIAAEDTRRTVRLLAHHGIAASMVSFHEHNARSRVPQLIRRLQAGDDVAIVTDAGTPGVSDPGLELVHAAVARGIRIDPIPGASAPLTALIASGFPMIPFTVFGFAPNRSNNRKRWLAEVNQTPHTFAFFEAPHRVRTTLDEAAPIFGERPIIVARELTKVHQEVLRGTAAELAEAVSTPRGEFTLVVGPRANRTDPNGLTVDDTDLVREFGHITNSGALSRRAAVSELAKRYGKTAREVYSAIERGKQLVIQHKTDGL